MNVLPGELRVDPQVLDSCGQRLAGLAGSLPPAPVGFSAVAGGDPLSAVAFTQQQAAEAPVLVGLPSVQTESAATAEKITQAAAMYRATDAGLGQRLHAVRVDPADGAAGGGGIPGAGSPAGAGVGGLRFSQSAAAAGAAGGGAPAAAGAGAGAGSDVPLAEATRAATQAPAAMDSALGSALSSGVSADSAAGSAMSMPMQMASQAAQVPAQLAGALASAPQGLAGMASTGMGQLTSAAGKLAEQGTQQPGMPGSEGASGGDGERAPVDAAAQPSRPRERQG